MGYDMDAVYREQEPSDFRFNIWGMAAIRDELMKTGVWDMTPLEDAPVSLIARSSDPNKVPIYKFCSNDGWVVTPEECALLAKACNTAADAGVTEAEEMDREAWERRVREFGAFCEVSAAHLGFEVF